MSQSVKMQQAPVSAQADYPWALARVIRPIGVPFLDEAPGRRRAAARRVREIASKLRGKLSREEATQAICWVTGQLADLAQKTAAQAAVMLRNGFCG